ncbi:MAG: polyphosphate polymerase domain-containing protein [Clostridium sp.]
MKNNGCPAYRHELKYLISETEKEIIKLRMKPVFQLDEHAGTEGYEIRSLYFDDYWNSAFEEKSMGIYARKKYRIRIYNYADHNIKLERKHKLGRHIYKESAPLTHEEVDLLLSGQYDFLLRSSDPLCREFYVESISHVMRPRVVVDYVREAYVMEEGTVRITFDSHVCAAILGTDIFDAKLPKLEVLEPGKLVMEVKFTEFLPQIVRSVLPSSASEFIAVSKYALCYEKTQYLHGWGYWKE